MSWLIYGANGYTGELVARLAVASAERPILAGRNRAAVESLANDLGLEYRAFDLDDPAAIDAGLQDVDVVAHCAGPFSRTSAPMVAGCLRRGVHYLDLTGEIDVFEAVYDQHEAAKASGVTLVPGVGFDVVPTDYLLARLHAELPTATHAEAALISRGGFSGGTIRSVVEGMRAGGQVRTNGRLAAARVGHEVRTLRLDARSQTVISVPLGDVSSGYRATGIPNIINFTNIPAGRVAARFAPITKRALSTGWI
ncbi:saccharopine dehydrogenase family protein, partial [Nocardia sp. NPDC003305]